MSEKQEVKEEKVSDGLAAKVRRLEEKLDKNKKNWIKHMNKHHQEGSDGTVRDGKASIWAVIFVLVIGMVGIALATEYLFNVPSEDDTLGIRMDTVGAVEVQSITVTGNLTATNLTSTATAVSGNFAVGTNLTVGGTAAVTGVLTCTAESIHNGGVDADYLTVDKDSTGIDTKASGALNIGTNTANAINIGKTTEVITLLGPVNTDEAVTMDTTLAVTGILSGNDIDARSATTLAIGTNTANAIDIGKTTEIVTVKGPVVCDETLGVTGVATLTVSPSVVGRYPILAKDATTQPVMEYGLCTNGQVVAYTTVFGAVPQIFLTYQEDAGADTLAEATSVNETNFTALVAADKSVAWMAVGTK